MAAEFVALADLLRVPSALADAGVAAGLPQVAVGGARGEAACDVDAGETPEPVPVDLAAALREARLFRAKLADALDGARAALLREIAAAVVARELAIAPCDVDAIVAAVGARAPIVRVRVAAEDAERLSHAASEASGAALGAVPFVVDSTLLGGDAVLELDRGTIDARLGVRLAQVLEAFA